MLQAKHARLKMIDYFCQTSDALKAQLHDDTALDSITAQFMLEHTQFQQGLPMYARKEEFLSLLCKSQCIVLIGGTGIGKPPKLR